PENVKGPVTLQRLFSAFPSRGPGLGLLLLRTAVGATAMMQGVACLAGTPSPVTAAVGLVAIALGGLLVVGFLTPFAASLILFGSVALAQPWWPVPGPASYP